MEIETVYKVGVRGLPASMDGVTGTLKGDVYLGERGRLCGSDKAECFATYEDAQERINKFKPRGKNKDSYQLCVIISRGSIGRSGKGLTPHNFFF